MFGSVRAPLDHAGKHPVWATLVVTALGSFVATGCDDDVPIPPMSDGPALVATTPIAAPSAAAQRRADAGPAYLTGCVPESTVPAAVAAAAPFEGCYRALRPGTGVHPREMPSTATARFDIAATVAKRRTGEVIACCYTWPVRPPGSPVYPRPSVTTPPTGVGTAQPVVVRAPAARPAPQGKQRALPFGLHSRPVVPALLRARPTPGGAGIAPSTRGTPGSRSPR